MKTFKTTEAIKDTLRALRKKGKKIAFVPTMGDLHQGHLSLAEKARKESDIVVLSIFVNPTQFGPKEDFKKYPRDLRRDQRQARRAGVDFIFAPEVKEIYPNKKICRISAGPLSKGLCAKARPGHFKGVATVVKRLFDIIEPDIAYFGEKDYQQAKIIQWLVKKHKYKIKVKTSPIIRASDGLALSSRNKYLSSDEREEAKFLNFSLQKARRMIQLGIVDSRRIKQEIKKTLSSLKHLKKIDYVEVVNAESLKPVKRIKGKAAILIAAHIGKTRLIDNTIVHRP